MRTFEDSTTWQNAHQGVLKLYVVTKKFPKQEMFVLVSQLLRAAISIPANIAEGFYRNTTKELINFLYIARGSCGEVLYYLILSKDLHYISLQEYTYLQEFYEGISKQLSSWIRSLKRKTV